MPRKFTKRYTRKKYGSKRSSKLATKKYVKSQLSKEIELKWSHFERNDSVSDIGILVDYTQLTQGVDINQRIGNKIQPKSFKVDIAFVPGDATNRIRMIAFQWHPNDATDTPSISELILHSTVGYITQGPLYPVYRSQYTLLKDKMITFSANTPTLIHKRFTLKPKKMCTYNYGTTTGTNHIYIAFVSDSAAIPHPQYTLTGMLKYTDA